MLTYWAARKSKFPFGSRWSDRALFDKYRKMMTLRHNSALINTAAFITGAQTNEVKLQEVEHARQKKRKTVPLGLLQYRQLWPHNIFQNTLNRSSCSHTTKAWGGKQKKTSNYGMINKIIAIQMANN